MRDYPKLIRELSAQRELVARQLDVYEKTLTDAVTNQRDTREALQIIQSTVEKVQNEIHTKISYVVSRCLSIIFEQPYEFEIMFEKKRNRTEACMTLTRDGVTLTNPIDEVGGGVIDIASFALRLACLFLSRPSRRRLVVLDEPFKFVHPPERRPRIIEMLNVLADEFDVQFIMVTGIEELITGEVVDMTGWSER